MPKRTDLHTIFLIGSGPIVIGQACEFFDYSGTQAVKALRDEVYIEPITPEICERIIARKRPDALLPTMGGQYKNHGLANLSFLA